MASEVHAQDPAPELPNGLFDSNVVAEIAGLARREENPQDPADPTEEESPLETDSKDGFDYRRQGLPITSSLMESTIKQLSQRVKGTEKFWNHQTAEAVLQLRADTLSDSQPLRGFWKRRQAKLKGTNRYRSTTA